jgi:hypothetical protein
MHTFISSPPIVLRNVAAPDGASFSVIIVPSETVPEGPTGANRTIDSPKESTLTMLP